jgi:hypothetical protein
MSAPGNGEGSDAIRATALAFLDSEQADDIADISIAAGSRLRPATFAPRSFRDRERSAAVTIAGS